MGLSGISLGSTLLQALEGVHASKKQTVQSEFSQLGQDLQSGNVTQAQSDFNTLSQLFSNSQQTTSISPLAQDFQTLGQALQSGNLSGAQTAYNNIQQDVQQAAGHAHSHHHHHGGGGSQSASASQLSALSQDFSSLGQALQSGSLSAAQTAYSTLQNDLASLGNATPNNAGSGAVSLAV